MPSLIPRDDEAELRRGDRGELAVEAPTPIVLGLAHRHPLAALLDLELPVAGRRIHAREVT